MSIYPLKQPLFFASLLLAVVCFFSACSKKSPYPTSTKYNDSTFTGVDTTGGLDTIASFNAPTGIAVDAAGNIYVADYGNNEIRKITPDGIVTTIAGNGNQGSINGPGNLATFNGPTSVTVDVQGNVYVADSNNDQIRKISAADGTVSTLAGSDSTGLKNGVDTAAYFFSPNGVAADAQGNVYVADAGNNAIRMVIPTGLTTTIAGNINPGSANGPATTATFNNPAGLAVDASGNIYVADMLNNLIRKISNGNVSTLAGHDTAATINGPDTLAAFYFPNSVAVDKSGNVYVTEYVTDLIRKIAPDGTVSTFAGNGMSGQADSTGTAASFNGPSGVAVDVAGNLYIADTFNNVIRKITPAGMVSTIAGSGLTGSRNGKALSLRKGKALFVAHKARPNNFILFNILAKKKPVPYYLRRN
jgi:sugar lactone lactonase YvrE